MQYENLQWNRDYLLTFKNPSTGAEFVVKDLRIEFDVELYVDNKEKTNKGTINIYNLSKSTAEAMKTRWGTLTLAVGYKGRLKTLLKGDVINVSTQKKGTDRITSFEMAPNFTDLSVKKITKTFPEQCTLKSVVDSIANTLGLSVPNVSVGEWQTTKCPYGYPAYGTGKQVLDELAKTYAIEWKIIDDVLVVTDRYGLSGGEFERAIVLSKDSGLIDIPFTDTEEVSKSVGQALSKKNEVFVSTKVLKPKKDGTPRKVTTYKARRYGTRVKALINPEIRPNSLFKVVTDDEVFNDFFRVRSVTFKGDTRGGEWTMEIWGDSVDAVEEAN